ncbi:MAG: gspD [Bacteroidetes bacterium]|jgi:type IV pilus assembly protein PilQ|nr:gspD [Bacteroidota bacterium]
MKLFFLLTLSICLSATALAQDRFTILEEKLNQAKVTMPGLDEKVQIAVNSMTIQDFVQGIALNHNLNVTVDPNVDVKVTNTFKDITAEDIFLYLCKRYDLDITFIGPIMNFSKYVAPPQVIQPKIVTRKIKVSYDSTANLLSFDLNNDSLELVTREITRVSGKNIVYAPDLGNKVLNGFVQNVPFNSAMDKLAFSNELKVTLTADNFYMLEKNAKEKDPKNTNSNNSSGNFANANSPKQINGLNYKVENGAITLDAMNVPIGDIVNAISALMGYNYFLFNELKGNATVSIKDASFEDFLNHLFNGTDYTFKKDANIYLFGDRNLEGLRVSKLVTLKNRTVEKIMDFIPADLKKGVDLKIFEDLNGIILSGSQPRINEIEAFLRQVDLVVPNVYIEVIIVDVRKSNTFSAGVAAGLGTAPTTTSGTVIPFDFTLGAQSINNLITGINGIASVNLGQVTPNFYIKLKALEEQGVLKLRSTPQLATLNGHKAELSIGQTEYYLEVSNNLVQNVNQSNILQSQQYKPVNADLSVSILPQISSDEQITMDIHVKQSSFTERISNTAPPGTINRDFKSLIRVKNGEMIMLGGLEENTKSESGSGLPGISRIPILKWLFGSRIKKKSQNKLTIFIKPVIIYS